MSGSFPLRCGCRRHALTGLRCNRCNIPICPDCSIVAPVGMICRHCARGGGKSKLYEVSPGSLLRAFLACLAVAAFGGWIMASFGFGLGFFGLWAAFLYGLALSEVALRVTGRKRGLQMEILVGVCAVLGIVLGLGIHIALNPEMGRVIYDPEMGAIPGFHPHSISPWVLYLKNPITYLSAGIAIFAAVGRIRNF